MWGSIRPFIVTPRRLHCHVHNGYEELSLHQNSALHGGASTSSVNLDSSENMIIAARSTSDIVLSNWFFHVDDELWVGNRIRPMSSYTLVVQPVPHYVSGEFDSSYPVVAPLSCLLRRAVLTSSSSWGRVVEIGRPLRGKSTIFLVCLQRFHSGLWHT